MLPHSFVLFSMLLCIAACLALPDPSRGNRRLDPREDDSLQVVRAVHLSQVKSASQARTTSSSAKKVIPTQAKPVSKQAKQTPKESKAKKTSSKKKKGSKSTSKKTSAPASAQTPTPVTTVVVVPAPAAPTPTTPSVFLTTTTVPYTPTDASTDSQTVSLASSISTNGATEHVSLQSHWLLSSIPAVLIPLLAGAVAL